MKQMFIIVTILMSMALPTRASDPSRFVTREYVKDQPVVMDMATGLMWQQTFVTGQTWQQALTYCEGLDYSGFSDWRLPNVNELRSLVNYDRNNPASDFPGMQSDWFWSSSSVSGYILLAWLVYFHIGNVSYGGVKDNFNDARCVRLRP